MAEEDAVVTATTRSLEAIVPEQCATSLAISPDSYTSGGPSEPSNKAAATTLFTAATAVSSSPYFSARIQSLSDQRSNFANEVEFEIECSKSHWTERSFWTSDSEDGRERVSNSDAFERLKEDAEWGMFFRRSRYDLKPGEKIAEGGQAEIFASSGTNLHDRTKRDLVVKVFKEGYSLGDLQRLWPRGLAKAALPYRYFSRFETSGLCWALDVQLLEGGKFAFVYDRHWGDLRKMINMQMLRSNGAPPFFFFFTLKILLRIAKGMASLHKFGLLHRDLKAANVLVVDKGKNYLHKLSEPYPGSLDVPSVLVADFESSVGTVGTGFWRAPEVLLALKNRSLTRGTLTQQTDVYSFAMTCYEVITGCEPFEGHPHNDYDDVLRGERPTLPDDTSPMLVDLVHSCWHEDPLRRPPFQEIVQTLRDLKSSTLAQRRWVFVRKSTPIKGILATADICGDPSDLRQLLDRRILENNVKNKYGTPFSLPDMLRFMVQIAVGVRRLHRQAILHKGLKSSFVKLRFVQNYHKPVLECNSVEISKFEPSAGAVDACLWQAPEILRALKNGTLKPETFTAQSDVYSYAMTCYEVITGKVPFDCHGPSPSDYDRVLRGERPPLPYWFPPRVANLISQCWHSDPHQRPSFEVISSKLDRLSYWCVPEGL